MSDNTRWHPYSMELTTVLYGRLSADYKDDVSVFFWSFGTWISYLSFRLMALGFDFLFLD